MTLAGALAFLGGVGLFLLGMRLMTDGLKVAAGDTLRAILATATRSQARGVASGMLITTIVQSSSAVIFATIGFVNAGLLSLQQAVGVIFGSNVGTTLTSWLVALIGFNVNLQALAMPAIGAGMALWILGGSSTRGALGQAVTGFGLFFLGIDVLKDTFDNVGDTFALQRWAQTGGPGMLAFVAAGMLMTVLMQSSSAALAVTLTAAAGGVIPFAAAAAMVIGANVGTTSTAAFAALGATSAAKRAAAAHVAFNVITAVLALLALPLLLWLVDVLAAVLGLGDQVAARLAIFHTATKALGLAAMWPATGWLVRQLERRFHSAEEDAGRPRFLDRNVLATPALAMDALELELHRMATVARRLTADALSSEAPAHERLAREAAALEEVGVAVAEFASGIYRPERDPALTTALPHALRVAQYLQEVGEQAVDIARLQPRVTLEDAELADAMHRLRADVAQLAAASQVDDDEWDAHRLLEQRARVKEHYRTFKAQLLRAGTAGRIPARRMAQTLELIGVLHRTVEQLGKAALYLQQFRDDRNLAAGPAPSPEEDAGAG